MNILLANPPVLEEGHLEAYTIPFGLLYIKQALIDDGHNVVLSNLSRCRSWNLVESRLRNTDYDVIGIPCYTKQRNSVFRLAATSKAVRPSCVTVLGGPHASFLDSRILQAYDWIDFIVRYEGELTFKELARVLRDKKPECLPLVRGLSYRGSNGQVRRNPDRELVRSLDELAMPPLHEDCFESVADCDTLMFHFAEYLHGKQTAKVAPILASRGCNNACVFCCNGSYWKRQRYHSAEYIVAQIESLREVHGIRFFDFYDDNFTGSKEHVLAICRAIRTRVPDIHWWCSSRANNVDDELLREMKAAGCFMVSYGVESGSQLLLDKMHKNVSVADVISAAEMTAAAGLRLRVTVTVGNPGETEATVLETAKLLNRLRPAQAGIFVVKLYPGTPLYNECVAQGFLDEAFWFTQSSPHVPTFTREHSLEGLEGLKKRLISSLEARVVRVQSHTATSTELVLAWS